MKFLWVCELWFHFFLSLSLHSFSSADLPPWFIELENIWYRLGLCRFCVSLKCVNSALSHGCLKRQKKCVRKRILNELKSGEFRKKISQTCELLAMMKKKIPYLHERRVFEFFNKMISMNFLWSSGFLTNSFMMKLHKILNLFLFLLNGVWMLKLGILALSISSFLYFACDFLSRARRGMRVY